MRDCVNQPGNIVFPAQACSAHHLSKKIALEMQSKVDAEGLFV